MSGHKVVPIINQHKDVFVAGGKCAKWRKDPSTHFDPKDSTHNTAMEELILCVGATYKISQPPIKSTASLASKKEGGITTRQRSTSMTGSTSATSNTPLDLTDPRVLLKQEVAPTIPPPPPILTWFMKHCLVKSVYALPEFLRDQEEMSASSPLTNRNAAGAEHDPAAKPFCYSVVIEFFSFKGKEKPDFAKKWSPWVLQHKFAPLPEAWRAGGSKAAAKNKPQLRYRELQFMSMTELQDWLLMMRSVITNYWHERLEASIIPEPQVYQFHTWALGEGGGKGIIMTTLQLVLSTSKLYVIARPDEQSFEVDPKSTSSSSSTVVPSFSVNTLQKCNVKNAGMPNRDTLQAAGQSECSLLFSSSKSPQVFIFANIEDCAEFVVELQRVFTLENKEKAFPYGLEN